MRLDKYLKVSRLIKRRTVANEACDAGRVLVNDKPAKASVQVKTGDTIEIQFGSKNVKVEVLDVKETVKNAGFLHCSCKSPKKQKRHNKASTKYLPSRQLYPNVQKHS